jgi:hypothetical protein
MAPCPRASHLTPQREEGLTLQPLDPSAVTDAEIARALTRIMDAVAVAGALLDIATERQVAAVFDACPLGDRASARADLNSWMAVVLDGTTGLQLGADFAREIA